jgi:hypothetical protein
MTDPNAVQMTRNDAWILAAIGSPTPIPLGDVVWKADHINHTIPGGDELEEAINHLGRTGLARFDDTGFRLTDDGEAWLKRFGWKSRGSVLVWLDLADAWERQQLPVENPDFRYKLKANELDKAVAGYDALAKRWMATHLRQRTDRGKGRVTPP